MQDKFSQLLPVLGAIVAFLIAAPLSGAWVWAVARYGGTAFDYEGLELVPGSAMLPLR